MSILRDKHINEKHGDLTILRPSTKKPNGYLWYYWCRCDCGNVVRLRYDRIRKKGNCGYCEDYKVSMADLSSLKGAEGGKEE